MSLGNLHGFGSISFLPHTFSVPSYCKKKTNKQAKKKISKPTKDSMETLPSVQFHPFGLWIPVEYYQLLNLPESNKAMRNICVSGTWKSDIISCSTVAQNQFSFFFCWTKLDEALLVFSDRCNFSTEK